jgi:hypothetical protein
MRTITTREEHETILRFDETNELAYLYTASAIQARRWARQGIELEAHGGGWRGRCETRSRYAAPDQHSAPNSVSGRAPISDRCGPRHCRRDRPQG